MKKSVYYLSFIGVCVIAITTLVPFTFGQTTISDIQRSIQQKEQEILILQEQLKALRETLSKAQKDQSTQLSTATGGSPSGLVLMREYAAFTRAIGYGSTGEDVKSLQLILNELGYYPEAVFSGYFGEMSVTALKRFQSAKGIVSSGDASTTGYGMLGPSTRKAINAIISGSVVPGIVSNDPVKDTSTSGSSSSSKDEGNTSFYAGKVILKKASASNATAKDEYIEIEIDDKAGSDVILAGWKVQSTITNNAITLDTVSPLFRFGRSGTTDELRLKPKDTLTIVTGMSPLTQKSFRENKCMGYLRHYYSFSPSISSSCPKPEDELEAYGKIPLTDDACRTYVSRLSSCKAPLSSEIPTTVSLACRYFVENNINYNACIDKHLSDADFWKDEWRIYLNRSDELWRKNREELVLLDQFGNQVDKVTY